MLLLVHRSPQNGGYRPGLGVHTDQVEEIVLKGYRFLYLKDGIRCHGSYSNIKNKYADIVFHHSVFLSIVQRKISVLGFYILTPVYSSVLFVQDFISFFYFSSAESGEEGERWSSKKHLISGGFIQQGSFLLKRELSHLRYDLLWSE